MDNLTFEPLIIILYNILKNYDSYVDVIWEQYQDENLNDYFDFYESEIFGEDKSTIKKMTRIHIINTCLYINKKIIPKIVKEKNLESLFLNTHIKITRYKTRLREQVAAFATQNNEKKYILKEFSEKNEEDLEKFIFSRLAKIKKWENDKHSLISDFYYLEELQKNQLKIILIDESIYIFLKELYENNNQSLIDNINYLRTKKEESIKKGATVPNSMLEYDGLFTAGKKTINEIMHEEKNGQVYAQLNQKNDKISIVVPKLKVVNTDINIEYDAEIDAVNFTAADFKILTALFELGGDNFLKGKEVVTFTMENLCNILHLSPCTKNYNAIAKSIFAFKTKEVCVNISDTHIRMFNIIKTIDIPILDSNRKKQWTISFHEELIKEIVANKYKRILTDTIVSFRYEISILLFKILAYDINNEPTKQFFTYTWDELAIKVGLTDKPSRIKERLKLALNEITSSEGIIYKYDTLNQDSIFNIYPNMEQVKKING